MTVVAANSPTRLTTLDVIGVGLCIEMFQQSLVLDEMQMHPNESILRSDLRLFPTSEAEKKLATEKRCAEVLEWGAKYFVENWPIPSVSICPTRRNLDISNTAADGKGNADFFSNRIHSLTGLAEMPSHKIASQGAFFRDEPEEILERAFQFFEGHPEVPALLLFATDGDQTRRMIGDMSRETHWGDGPRRFDAMAESIVALVVARRERIDALRPFMPPPETALHAAGKAPPGFKPSKFLPEPWTYDQLQQFDSLPSIAVLHRPIRVSYRLDQNDKPTFDVAQQASLMYPQERQSTFKAGFDAALQEIPGGKPARVLYDAGSPVTGIHVIPLAQAVDSSLPKFDLYKSDEGYNIHERIGNTGAASPFVQCALAIIAGYRNKDASITVNLRQRDEATITVVTHSADTRKHIMGDPIDFDLAPWDGGLATSVAPAIATNNAKPATPVSRPAVTRTVALGTRLQTGDECPQSGMWQCDPPDAAHGAAHFIAAWRTLPQVTVEHTLTAWQKLRGDAAMERVSANWTLISYDEPT